MRDRPRDHPRLPAYRREAAPATPEWIVHCGDCRSAWKARDWATCPSCGGTTVYSGTGPGPPDPTGVVGATLRRALYGR